jgi:hypothetical protein
MTTEVEGTDNLVAAYRTEPVIICRAHLLFIHLIVDRSGIICS